MNSSKFYFDNSYTCYSEYIVIVYSFKCKLTIHNIYQEDDQNIMLVKKPVYRICPVVSQTFFFSKNCVLCQAKVVGKTSYAGSGNLSGYDEYVPMVDKAVDAGWKKQASLQMSQTSKGG